MCPATASSDSYVTKEKTLKSVIFDQFCINNLL